MFRTECLLPQELKVEQQIDPIKVLIHLENEEDDHVRHFKAEEALNTFKEKFVRIVVGGEECKGFLIGVQVSADKIAFDFAGGYCIEGSVSEISEFGIISREEGEDFFKSLVNRNNQSFNFEAFKKRIEKVLES